MSYYEGTGPPKLNPLIQSSSHIGRNLYTFNNTNGEERILCHVPLFLPYSRRLHGSQNLDYSGSTGISLGMRIAAGAFMAIDHWNNGKGVVVNDIQRMIVDEKCPIRFTSETFDTERSPNKAISDFMRVVSRSPGSNNNSDLQPCAIIGAIFSSVTSKLGILPAVYGVLQVSPGSSSLELEDREQYRFFARTHPSDGHSGANAVEYLQKLGVKRFAVVYSGELDKKRKMKYIV